MDIISIVSLYKSADKLLSLGAAVLGDDDAKCEQVAQYLADVGECIEKILGELKADIDAYVIQLCAELEFYGEDIRSILHGVVPESDIEAISGNVLRLAQALMASYEGEAGTGALARTKALPELDKIVGRFRGHAKVLRKKQAPKLWGSLATGLGTIAAVAASSVADAQPYLGALKTFVALKQRSGDENGDEAEA